MAFLPEAFARLVTGRVRAPVALNEKGSRTGTLVAFEQLGQPVWSPRDYGHFAREGFMQNAILYRSVRMIAEAAASIPLILYEGAEEIEDHPLVDLIRQPSLDHTCVDFLESWYGFLLVAGNAYVEAVALNGELRELHVLRPDRMKVIPGPDGWPEGYEYTAGGQSIRFMDEAVPGVRPILHIKMFHPANDHYGMSPIEAASVVIDIHNEASKWNKALLDNSARPSGALVYAASNGQMTGEQFQRLKDELETSYQGARHAGRPLLLEGGLDWKPLSLSPKDMDFIQAKNSAAREIALAMGVPPQLLGIPGDNTYASPQTSGYALKGVIPAPATLGRTLDPLNAGPEGRIDWAAKVRVKLSFGTLTSADLVSVGSGVNLAAVRNAVGEWEVLQFLNAVLVDVGTYELTGLLRGQGGTEGAMRAPVAANALFVVLDAAVMQLPLGLNDLNLPLNWRYGPSNRSIGDASYVVTQHAFKGLGRRPLSPARVKGARAVGGDLTVTWERRTRIGGDSWDVAEVPLGEDVEAYEVEIMSGVVVKRTILAAVPAAVYTAAQQVSDFGSVQGAVSVRVYQKSTLFGRGAARVALV